MELDVIISGFGGQGVLSTGKILAYAALIEEKYTTWIPAYGAEMRGGTANCSIVISDDEIASPCIENPDYLIAFNTPSLRKFEQKMKSNGTIIVNSSLTTEKPLREDINYIYLPLNDVAKELGEPKCFNMIALGIFLEASKALSLESAKIAVAQVLSHKPQYIQVNTQAIEKGAELVRQPNLNSSSKSKVSN